MITRNIAIIGAGNIGISLAKGLVASGKYNAKNIALVKRDITTIGILAKEGYSITNDIPAAVERADVIVLSVLPQQLKPLLVKLNEFLLPDKHLIVSVVSGVTISDITVCLKPGMEVVRAMPNIAISIRESMTCIAHDKAKVEYVNFIKDMFNAVGETIEIHEELMTSATALCACGIAFFLRAIRAASQGGIELGFHADEALKMAAQTAKGAASLLKISGAHPENEIDKVTSPKGCTIAGLNEMEYKGFSAALIKGIKVSAKIAGELYKGKN